MAEVTALTRLRREATWLASGAAGMLLVLLVTPRPVGRPGELRWSAIGLLVAIAGVTTAVVGPWLLPLAQSVGGAAVRGREHLARRGRRLRPLTQGAAVGVVAAAVGAAAVAAFPDALAPVHLDVGRGLPGIWLDQLAWAVPLAGLAGALLGVAAWGVVTQRPAVHALGQLVRHAGAGTAIAWTAAGANVVAAAVSGVALSAGAVGAGPVPQRAAAVIEAGPWWPLGWTLWAIASVGLLAVLVLLGERARPVWRPIAFAVAAVAIAADLVSTALLAAGLPATAHAAAAGDTGLFLVVERTALALSGPIANTLYGAVGLAFVRGARRALHPLVRLLGTGAFSATVVTGLALQFAPQWLGPIAAVSVTLFIAFATGFGWQLAVSRRRSPALEAQVRRALRTLVPLHPVPVTGRMRDLVAVDLRVDATALVAMLPGGLRPRLIDGAAYVTVLGGVASGSRPTFFPRWLTFGSTPMVLLRVPVVDTEDRQRESITYLRGWADSTFGASAVHWLTEFQLSRIDLGVRCDDHRWSVRGSAGSVELELHDDPSAPPLVTPAHGDLALVFRGGRQVEVAISAQDTAPRPARVVNLRIPYLGRLGAEPVAAAYLGSPTYRFGRARWR